MKQIKLLTIIALIISSITVDAQVQLKGNCGTNFDESSIAKLKESIKHIDDNSILMRNGIIRYVPVTFHFIADDSGNGYPREEQALEQLAALNELYAPQEIIFYIDEINYKADSRIYNTPANSSAIFQMRVIRDLNAMNVYVTKTAESGNGGPGSTLAYYSGSEDWIVIRKDEFNGITGTLGHEIGHFFTLAHTFLGWECDPYNEDSHGNPVNSIWSPCFSQHRIDLENGTNCQVSGDLICDTPPDYNFGLGWSVGGDRCAPYEVGTMDPNGDVVDPMEENIMGYFIDCDQYVFTNTQQNVVRSNYQSSGRSYLRTGLVPNTDEVMGPVEYNYPIGDEESPTYTNIEFDWEDVPGANQYLFIVDRFPSFTSGPKRITTSQSSVVVDELTSGARYFWKVWPFNESQTDAGWSDNQSFVVGTSSAVNEISSVEDFNVYPNPVVDGKLVVAIRSTESFEAQMRLMDISGRVYHSSNGHVVTAGDQWNIELNTEEFAPGIYIVQIVSDTGILTSKFAVQ